MIDGLLIPSSFPKILRLLIVDFSQLKQDQDPAAVRGRPAGIEQAVSTSCFPHIYSQNYAKIPILCHLTTITNALIISLRYITRTINSSKTKNEIQQNIEGTRNKVKNKKIHTPQQQEASQCTHQHQVRSLHIVAKSYPPYQMHTREGMPISDPNPSAKKDAMNYIEEQRNQCYSTNQIVCQ